MRKCGFVKTHLPAMRKVGLLKALEIDIGQYDLGVFLGAAVGLVALNFGTFPWGGIPITSEPSPL